jgi:hypothetical protein
MKRRQSVMNEKRMTMQELKARLEQLRALGLVEWNGQALGACEAVQRCDPQRTVTELLLADRD